MLDKSQLHASCVIYVIVCFVIKNEYIYMEVRGEASVSDLGTDQPGGTGCLLLILFRI